MHAEQPNATVRVATVVDRTWSEGPGARMALWVQGCRIQCPGCCNPEMFDAAGGRSVAVAELVERLRGADGIEGLSLLGGEPFHQAGPLAELALAARALGLTVMVYTGYVLDALRARRDPSVDALLAQTDLLVDGPYVHSRRSARRRFIGSENQRLHHLTPRYRDHPDLRSDGTQSVTITLDANGGMTVSGWPWLADALRPREPSS